MRWEQLIADLQLQAELIGDDERDAIAEDLRDEEWAKTSWLDLVAGRVVLDVHECGLVQGDFEFLDSPVIVLSGPREIQLIQVQAVRALVRSDVDARDPLSLVQQSWRAVLRDLRDDQAEVRVVLIGGGIIAGQIASVGADFFSFRLPQGDVRVIPLASVIQLSAQRY